MYKTVHFVLAVGLVVIPSAFASEWDVPSTATLTLSLKTISKALAGCRTAYTQVLPPAKIPAIKQALGTEDYDKDMASLGTVEKLTNALIGQPDKISGDALVFILSLSDDFALGAASTQTSLLRKYIESRLDSDSQAAQNILLTVSELSACQHAIFNASDDYLTLVLNYVGAQDQALRRSKTGHP